MSRLSVTVDTWDPLTGLDRDTLRKVWVRAANKAISKARTQASKLVRAEYVLKAGDISRVIKIYRASYGNLSAALRAQSPRLSLTLFQARQRAAGVQVRVRRTGRGKVLPHTFIAVMRSGHRGVFIRSNLERGRLPIEERKGPSPADLIAAKNIFPQLETRIREDVGTIYNHELGFELQRQGMNAPRK